MAGHITPISAAPNPLAIEASRVTPAQAPTFDAVAPLQAGLQAGAAVGQQIENIEETQKATEFDALLQSGEQGMNAALADAQAQGADITGVPDPKLYLRSTDDMARWYAFLAQKLEKQQTKTARGEAFEQISGEEPREGFAKLVGTGDISAAEAGLQVRKLDFEKRLQGFISGETKLVPDEGDVPEGATPINISEFSEVSPTLNDSLTGVGLSTPPDDIKVAVESAAKKLNLPTNMLMAIAARESAFKPDAKNPKSSATGLGQLIDATGQEMLKKAQADGLIGKDVKYEEAVVDPEMNMLMTGLLFQQNLETTGNVRDALLAHRIGAGAVDEFNKTGKFEVEGRDESADIQDWIKDVMTGGEVTPGEFGGGEPDLNTIAGINLELDRLSTQAEFTATPAVKARIKVLENRKDDLVKAKTAKDKAAGKKAGLGKDQKVADTIDLVIALADNVEPSGVIKGSFKNLLAFFNVDAETATLNQFSGLLAGQMAKGVGGESGRLTDQDRAFALAAMPTATDSPEIRANKKSILRAIVANIRDAEGGDEAAQRRIRRAVYINASQFGKQMEKKQLLELWKIEPTDALIERFLWSNAADGDDPAEVAKLRVILEGAPAVKPAAPAAGATQIQGRGEVPVVPPPPATGPGLGLDLPPFETGQ